MPRVNTVKKARKPQGSCPKCGVEISPGDGYKWWKFRYGGRHVRCLDPKCRPKRSELTQSPTLSRVLETQEDFEPSAAEVRRLAEAGDMRAALDHLAQIADDAYSTADEIADECREAADAWEHGNSQLEERADYAEEWRDEIETAQNAIDDASSEDEDELDIENLIDELDSAIHSCQL